MTYQVLGWSIYFENDRSRQRDRCSFVCVPNKQHGVGLAKVLSLPDGAAIYGIWCLILGACSQQKNPRDGWLTHNGLPSGSPWTHADLSLKFRRPESEIERALSVLSSCEIGWLQQSNRQVTADSPSSPTDSPPTHLERREGKGIERREGKGGASLPLALVLDNWNATPGVKRCLVMSDKRRRQLEVRLREPFFFENWNQAIQRIRNSRFCSGENDRGWVASFDWFIQPDTCLKVMEGKYDNRNGNHGYAREKPDPNRSHFGGNF